jgi:selenocysteine lyase/cysteine desulfurase
MEPAMLTPASRTRDFPALETMTYLNTAAESIPPLCVGEALEAYWRHKQRGMRGRDEHFATVESCREVSARLLGREPGEVGFCSCSSEAYNLLATALNPGPEDEVVVTDLDFPAGATPWLRAAVPPRLHLWRARGGELQVGDLIPLLNSRTRLVQVSLVSFLNGHRIAWAALRDAVRREAPEAILAVDVTQALGRVVMDCGDADIQISSTHKWTLGIHGGCIVGIPRARAARLTTRAGGWHHLANAFADDRFERARPREGAASFAVGMPNFAALYALNASLRYLEAIGVGEIARHADPLVAEVHRGLRDLGIEPMAPLQPGNSSGIVAFRHAEAPRLHAALEQADIHVMHQAGRIRISLHGYNDAGDVERLLATLGRALTRSGG